MYIKSINKKKNVILDPLEILIKLYIEHNIEEV